MLPLQSKFGIPKLTGLSLEEINFLQREFEKLPETSPFSFNIKLSSKIARYGIYREVGTVNDELARFIFDGNTGDPVRRQSLKAELIEWNNLAGVRIFSLDTQNLSLRAAGFNELIHPQLSTNPNGTFHSLYVFPEIIHKIAGIHGIDLVLVKSWGINSIFGGFDPAEGYYQTNFWELENNDALKFSDLIRQGQLAFLGTHDLIAHIAGANDRHWSQLKVLAQNVHETLLEYFKSVPKPTISALILPYTIGVILDDLAQPPSYGSKSHQALLTELLLRVAQKQIPANISTLLTDFPKSFQDIIELSRRGGIEKNKREIVRIVNALIREILEASLVPAV
jgi:hypothetical protein